MMFFPNDAKLCSNTQASKPYVHLQINQLEIQVQKEEDEAEQQTLSMNSAVSKQKVSF